MARTSLSQAAKQRKAASTATKTATKTPVIHTPEFISIPTSKALAVPGLSGITPNDISAVMPTFDGHKYTITDPLKPNENIPQITEGEFTHGMSIYEGGIRALKLTGTGLDLTRERFVVEGKRAKAFGAGIKAATEFERVEGDFLDYQNQLEINSQKGITLAQSQHRTKTTELIRIETEAELNEKLAQARIATELAKETTADKQSKLDEFRKQIKAAA